MSWTFLGRSTDLRRFNSFLICSAPSRVMGILSDAIDFNASAWIPGLRETNTAGRPYGHRPRTKEIGKMQRKRQRDSALGAAQNTAESRWRPAGEGTPVRRGDF